MHHTNLICRHSLSVRVVLQQINLKIRYTSYRFILICTLMRYIFNQNVRTKFIHMLCKVRQMQASARG